LLKFGAEDDLYEGEIKDLILSVLSEALKNQRAGSRRLDVLSDVVEANGYSGLSAARTEEIKRLLKGYDGLPSPLRQRLMNMGFSITDDGKHYKLTYYGDGRYQTILAKTPSDHRAGANNALEIAKMMF
jgi:hypothetical protein